MYEEFYNLREEPFRLTPDPSFIYMSAQHREAFAGLVHTICRRPGLTVLVGEAGTGKTTLLHSILELLAKRQCITAMCTNPTLTREDLYEFLLAGFGVECESGLKSRRLIAFQAALEQMHARGRQPILIIDEAQSLSAELLEEVRLLLNLETPRAKLLDIILSGQPELMEKLRVPALRQLKQRVSYFCRLEALTLDEMQEYVQHRLRRAGLVRPPMFSAASMREIYAYTRGIPRVVNTLCDQSLRTGLALRSPQITAAIVRETAADLDLTNPVPAEDASPPLQTTIMNTSVAAGTTNGTPPASPRVPLETYTERQSSVRFLTGLIERWR